MGWITLAEAERQSGVAAATIRSALRHALLEGREEDGRGWIVPEHTLEQLLVLREEQRPHLPQRLEGPEPEEDLLHTGELRG